MLEKMLEFGYRIGGEQSGHTIFTDFATTGDGQLTALQFLQILSRSGKKASELASICPSYPQVLVNVKLENRQGLKEAVMACLLYTSSLRRLRLCRGTGHRTAGGGGRFSGGQCRLAGY